MTHSSYGLYACPLSPSLNPEKQIPADRASLKVLNSTGLLTLFCAAMDCACCDFPFMFEMDMFNY